MRIGVYTITPARYHAYHLVQASNHDRDRISDAIDLLIQSSRTIDAIGLDSYRIDMSHPKNRDKAECRLLDDRPMRRPRRSSSRTRSARKRPYREFNPAFM